MGPAARRSAFRVAARALQERFKLLAAQARYRAGPHAEQAGPSRLSRSQRRRFKSRCCQSEAGNGLRPHCQPVPVSQQDMNGPDETQTVGIEDNARAELEKAGVRNQPVAAETGISVTTLKLIPQPFYVREVPERGMVATASDSLSPVPQVAIATAAAGNRSLPAPAQGGPRWGLARPHRGRRAGPSIPRVTRPVLKLGRPVAAIPARPERKRGSDPHRKRIGTQE